MVGKDKVQVAHILTNPLNSYKKLYMEGWYENVKKITYLF